MKIGIDIDGVLTDIHRFYLDYGSKYSYEKKLQGIKNLNGYEIEEVLDGPKIMYNNFWNKYLKYYRTKKYTREFANEITKKLKKQGNEIYIITARRQEDKKYTTKWLKENKICYNKVICTKEKLKYCIDNGIDVMIEDCVENINKISEYIQVLCFDNPWNKECEGKNITRCYSWYDIYEKLQKFSA